ncbi:endonuclease/exonuclease/phosphatase family protein [Sphaerisporangium rufum]|uniref:endonuclease/exonuclease/phosphatase family protein n=1 Tax=Sphaerisporangium rufum TaxID=1381558 RepID=UPI00194F81BB|nr:endonuclease/exonuclease/phosphatase family protein [Sphaerisporangium rufum]
MKGRLILAAAALLAVTSPAPVREGRPELAVMTWNTCAGTNSDCGLYRADAATLGETVARYATDRPIRPGVILLQEFCTGADDALRRALTARTGRSWSVRSWALPGADGAPYLCHPDRAGRPRGAASIVLAVADEPVTFQVFPLPSPPWYVGRAVLCATLPGRKVRVCGTHLSSGRADDDRQPGAPYRTRQVTELMAHAAVPGYRSVFGGDLNIAPPDSGDGTAAARRAIAPAYRAYQECDRRGTARTGQWTHRNQAGTKKLDYLFAPHGTRVRCDLAPLTPLSDHRPLYLRVSF